VTTAEAPEAIIAAAAAGEITADTVIRADVDYSDLFDQIGELAGPDAFPLLQKLDSVVGERLSAAEDDGLRKAREALEKLENPGHPFDDLFAVLDKEIAVVECDPAQGVSILRFGGANGTKSWDLTIYGGPEKLRRLSEVLAGMAESIGAVVALPQLGVIPPESPAAIHGESEEASDAPS
jgi:hypothetical protein